MVLLRHTMLYLPAQLLAPVLQLVAIVVWTHFLAPAEFGRFALVLATQELVFLLTLSWLASYGLRFGPQRDDALARRRYFGTETSLLLLILPLHLPLALLLSGHLGAEHLVLEGGATFAYFAARSLNAYLSERARSDASILAYTLLQGVGPLGGLALGLVVVHGSNPSAAGLLLAYAAAQVLACALALPLMGWSPRPGRIDPGLVGAALAYGGPLLGLSVLGWIGENSIRYVVEGYAGAAAFGLLAVGWGLGRRAASFAAMLVTAAAFPLAARLMNAGERLAAMAQLRANAALLLGLLLPVVGGLVWVGPALTDLFVAQAYAETTRQVLVPAAVAGAAFSLRVHTTDQILLLERRFGLMALIDGVEIVATGGLAVAGLALAGLPGAAIGAAAGSLLTMLLSGSIAYARFGFTLPMLATAKVLASCAVMSVGLALSSEPAGLLAILAHVALGAILYVCAAALFWQQGLRSLLRASAAKRRHTFA